MSKKNSSNTDLFGDSNDRNSDNDFAALFEQSMNTTSKRLRNGDKIQGQILSMGKNESFVSTGTPQDATIMTADLLDTDGTPKYKVGDMIDVIVIKIKNDEVFVARKGSRAAATDLDSLEDAFDMELPLEGKVTEAIKGGFRVLVQGQTAFCPISQMDSKHIQDQAPYIGKNFTFLITQFEPRKRNLVVSRRKILDQQKAENEGVWVQTHQVGDMIPATVSRTENFGAFMDLGGGVEGLVHISEISFTRLKHANEGVKVGDQVQVKIIKVAEEEGRLRISLSIKQASGAGDPWMQVPQQFPVGTILDGTVDNKANFGLFVSIAPGINGLLPKSKWSNSPEAQNYENKKRGDVIKVRIDEVRFEERKIALGLPTEAEDESWRTHQQPGMASSMGTFAAAFAQANKKK